MPRSAWECFWSGYRSGLPVEDAAMAASVGVMTARRWVHQRGGVAPPVPAGSGRFLSLEERIEIQSGLVAGLSVAEIARRIGRHRSTVGREIARNGPASRYRPYRALTADMHARKRAQRPKPRKLACHDRLAAEVARGLARRWSPREISERLVMDFPDDPTMRISHEAIYQSLFMLGRGGLRRELVKALRSGRAIRRPRRRIGERRGRIPGMVMISERDATVDDRAVPGHWEGDLIMGAKGASAIGTLVERTTRYTMLLHLPGDHAAATVRDAVVARMTALPQQLRRTLTWDQGTEMSQHAQIAIDADIDVYFCDPSSPWQRGTNENTNGLLRQYFPKGTDLSKYTADDLAAIEAEFNDRPRAVLGYKKPTEVIQALLLPSPT